MSQRLHDTAMEILGDARPAGAGRPARRRRRPLAAVVPVLSRRDHLRRHLGDPAQHHRRARARACRAECDCGFVTADCDSDICNLNLQSNIPHSACSAAALGVKWSRTGRCGMGQERTRPAMRSAIRHCTRSPAVSGSQSIWARQRRSGAAPLRRRGGGARAPAPPTLVRREAFFLDAVAGVTAAGARARERVARPAPASPQP